MSSCWSFLNITIVKMRGLNKPLNHKKMSIIFDIPTQWSLNVSHFECPVFRALLYSHICILQSNKKYLTEELHLLANENYDGKKMSYNVWHSNET